ncbi:MAG: hypothetical protein JW955_08035 [Sedimentisphaerales bacterium]|nr:hypothetical protein [Sedimentisphaerales bacterium]
MIAFITQLHSIAQTDSDQWVNFLILAILAIFWLFGTLVKAATKKRVPPTGQAEPGRPQRETWQQRLARKAQELQRVAEAQRRQAEERVRRMQDRAAVRERAEPPPGNISVRTGKGGESILVYEQAGAMIDSTREQHAARQRQARETVAAAGRKAAITPPEPMATKIEAPLVSATDDVAFRMPLEPRSEESATRGQPPGRESGPIIDFNDPDALQRAILHYEILDKPVGLRDVGEQAARF